MQPKRRFLDLDCDLQNWPRAVRFVVRGWRNGLGERSARWHHGDQDSPSDALIWSRVDLVRKLITIPKSKNGNTRHTPLNSIALAAFQELFARSSGQGRVFVNMQGEPLKGYKHWFDPAVREAGISFFTWYCLRHTFASRLVMAGVDLRTVAELMGHKTIQMTCDTHISHPLTRWLRWKSWLWGGRRIGQLTPKLAPALSSKLPTL